MIIDTTISAMENRMGKQRRIDESFNRINRKAEWNHFAVSFVKKQFRPLTIETFLAKQNKTPGPNLNYIVFWQNGKIIDAQPLAEPTEEEKIQAKLREEERHLKKLLNKFVIFMKFAQNI